jgi:hypothetical protein
MRRALPIFIILLAIGAGILYAKRPGDPPSDGGSYQNDGRVQISRPVNKGNDITLESETHQISKAGDPVENTLKALLATSEDKKGESAIPEGTRLLKLDVKDGLATLDLTSEFSQLNKHGSTQASLAVKALCQALAQFPRIVKMTVLVDGKLFEDAHFGTWDNIAVRDGAADTTSPNEGGR